MCVYLYVMHSLVVILLIIYVCGSCIDRDQDMHHRWCTRTCMHTKYHACEYTYLLTHTYQCVHERHAYVHMHTHTYICMRIHIHKLQPPSRDQGIRADTYTQSIYIIIYIHIYICTYTRLPRLRIHANTHTKHKAILFVYTHVYIHS